MSKARVRLKDLNKSLKRLRKEVERLRGKAATASAEKSLRTLHQSLSKAETLMAKQCPDSQFRDFLLAEPMRAARATRAKKTTRKRTRKVR